VEKKKEIKRGKRRGGTGEGEKRRKRTKERCESSKRWLGEGLSHCATNEKKGEKGRRGKRSFVRIVKAGRGAKRKNVKKGKEKEKGRFVFSEAGETMARKRVEEERSDPEIALVLARASICGLPILGREERGKPAEKEKKGRKQGEEEYKRGNFHGGEKKKGQTSLPLYLSPQTESGGGRNSGGKGKERAGVPCLSDKGIPLVSSFFPCIQLHGTAKTGEGGNIQKKREEE